MYTYISLLTITVKVKNSVVNQELMSLVNSISTVDTVYDEIIQNTAAFIPGEPEITRLFKK